MTNSLLSISEFTTLVNACNINTLRDMVIGAVIIVVSNCILVPLFSFAIRKIKQGFAKFKNWLKSKQKTPENDGELPDLMLEAMTKVEAEILNTIEQRVTDLVNQKVLSNNSEETIDDKIEENKGVNEDGRANQSCCEQPITTCTEQCTEQSSEQPTAEPIC